MDSPCLSPPFRSEAFAEDLVQRTQERFEPLVLATTFVPRNSTRALA